MTPTDPSYQASPIEASEGAIEELPATNSPADASPASDADSGAADASRRRILIGSQRDPAAYLARQHRDWKPIEEKPKRPKREKHRKPNGEQSRSNGVPSNDAPAAVAPAAAVSQGAPATSAEQATPAASASQPADITSPKPTTPELVAQMAAVLGNPEKPVAAPNIREQLSADVEDEIRRALGDSSLDDLLGMEKKSGGSVGFEPESLQSGRVVAVRRDDVFIEFGGREQGVVSLRSFDVPPRVGAEIQVVVQRLNPEDGLYELSLPNKAVQVDDWSDLTEGMMVDVNVTGHNTGGLECEVNHIRGFIPVSQVALYRIEDLAQFVGQHFTCVITEANPDRRNLVLSRRAVLEREREQAKDQMLHTLAPGQIRDGVVRKLMDFGAFVDLGGGVDGLLHISQLAWGRVKHPSDVLHEGQTIKVRVDRVDPETGRISLAYRDLMESPWVTALQKYPPNTIVSGTVTKLMDFGAFVEVEPGIEGLVHISELSHKRVWRASDVVKEGEQVEAMVLSVDPQAQRMSLSMKELSAPPEPEKKPEDELPEAAPTKKKSSPKSNASLLGGLGKRTGDRFGLKW